MTSRFDLMAAKKNKHYVVWEGFRPGVYSSWSDCELAIRGYSGSKSMLDGRTSAQINDLVARALRWLNENEYPNPILKWETQAWG